MNENFEKIMKLLDEQEGGFGISTHQGEWVASLEWGREAPDSPMAAAAAYAQEETYEDALKSIADQAGLNRDSF